MKRFDDMTDAEVLALTDEQIDRIIDFECADNGSGLLPPDPGPEPEKPKDARDVTVYEFGSMLFTTREAAQAVADEAAKHEQWENRYVNGYYGDMACVRVDRQPTIEPRRYYSLAGWDAAKDTVLKYEAAKKEWAKRTEEYKQVMANRSSSTEWVRNRISQVHSDEWQRVRVADELARYVELAEGDEAMARRFLLKAKPDAERFLPPVEAQAGS